MHLPPVVGGGSIMTTGIYLTCIYLVNVHYNIVRVCVCVLVVPSIEKNPQLCYTETVSWRHILPDGFNYRRIQQNKPNYECVDVCPVGSNCPTGEVTGPAPLSSSRTRHLCWSEKHCQKGKLAASLAILLSVHNIFKAPMHASRPHI